MGWGSFFAGLAADAAKDYVNKRGLDGSIEDIAGLAKGVKNFFSSDSDEGVSVVEKFYEYYNGGHYVAAQNYVKDFYRENSLQRDYVFYFLLAAGRSCEGYLENNMNMLNEASSNLNRAKTMLSSYDEDYQHLLDLEKEIEGYRADVLKANEGTSNWESIVEDIEKHIENQYFDKALQLVVDHYDRFEDKRDYWYYEWRAYIYLNQLEYESLDNPSKDMSNLIGLFRSELANARLADGAKNNLDTTQKLEDRFESWKVELANFREWDKCMDNVRESINNKKFENAQTVLKSYYSSHDKEKYYWYYETKIHILKALSQDKETLKEDLDFKENCLKSALSTIAEYQSMCSEDDNKDRKELQDMIEFLKDITIELRSKIISDEGHFDAAKKLLEDHFKVKDYNFYQPMARNESKRFEFEASKPNPDLEVLKTMMVEAETYINLAISTAPSSEIQNSIKEIMDARLNKGKALLDQQSKISSSNTGNNSVLQSSSIFNDQEQEYAEEIKVCLEDGEISDRERRLLNKLRLSLGISESRAMEIEALCDPNSISSEEQEFAEELKACIMDDGIISDRERRLLNRLAKSLGITADRANEIEKIILKK